MRRERQVALARVVLASAALLTVWLAPTEPRRYDPYVYWFLTGYVLFSLAVAACTLRREAPSRYRMLVYGIDLVTASVAVIMSARAGSPSVPLVAFVLFTGTRWWKRRVALWTTVGLAAGFLLLAGITGLARDGTVELDRFIIHGLVLSTLAAVLLKFAAYEDRMGDEIERLAAPPDTTGQSLDHLLVRLLEWGAAVTSAGRVVLAWENSEEAGLHLVSWRTGDCQHVRESPGALTPMVAQRLNGSSFLCRHAGSPDGVVLYLSPAGLQRWRGTPVHPVLQSRFSMDTVLSLAFAREHVRGRVFFLDKPALTADDLGLGEIVSRQIATQLDRFHLYRRLTQAAVLEERLRLARDLHDGAFHLLTGAALEAARLLRMPEGRLAGARERIREIQDSLSDGQHTLRLLIDGLRVEAQSHPAGEVNLEDRLKRLAERLERQWGVQVRWAVEDCEDVPRAIRDEIYLMVHEALVNTARHAKATTASVTLTVSGEEVRIVIADDGRGFDVMRQGDHEALLAGQIGPWTLRERVGCLGGAVAIESGPSLTVVEIRIPIRPVRA